MRTDFSALELTGRSRAHIVQVDAPRFAAHPRAVDAFLDLRAAAALDGFDLRPFSSFRDFRTQARIWRRKFLLEKPIYDQAGTPIDAGALAEEQRVWAILGFSAVPGGSRHHWGTEIDVVEGRAVDAGAPVDLLPHETAPGGVFAELHAWLDEHLIVYGFHRPYDRWRGGMFAEPWHLSFSETSAAALKILTPEMIAEALKEVELPGGPALLRLLPEIWERHILNVAGPV